MGNQATRGLGEH